MLRTYSHTWMGSWGPGDSVPSRQLLFSEVAPRKAQLEAVTCGAFLNTFSNRNCFLVYVLALFRHCREVVL